MNIDEIVQRLERRLRNGVVSDHELRERIIARYDDGTLNGIPADAIVRIDWERPRSDAALKRALDQLDRIAKERWGAQLPRGFKQLYEVYGRIVMSIRWREDGEDAEAGCAWDWPEVSLASSWVAESAWEETHPDGSHHVVFSPVIPFMSADSSEPVALVFRHVENVEVPSVEWIIPDCFHRSYSGLSFEHATSGGFTQWFASWIEAGLPHTGDTYL